MTEAAPPPIVLAPVVPPATIGILGAGPTTRYFEHAASRMGYRTVVLDPHLAQRALLKAATECDVITVVDRLPIKAMRTLVGKRPMHPSPDVVELCTDRIALKQFLEEIGVGVGPHMTIETDDDIASAADKKFSAILKPRHHGEGRRGQVRVAAYPQLLAAWETLGRLPCVLEQRLMLGRELAITVARTPDGRVAAFPVSQQQYVHGKLEISYAPASLLGSGQADAAELGAYIATELGIVGVLAIHMFVVGRDVYVHQLIPRPSAVGLFTLDSSRTNQYEQQVRAACGLALGESEMTVPGVAIVGLAGELWSNGEPKWERVLSESTASLHLYDDEFAGQISDGLESGFANRGHLAALSGTAAGSTSVVRRLRKQLTNG